MSGRHSAWNLGLTGTQAPAQPVRTEAAILWGPRLQWERLVFLPDLERVGPHGMLRGPAGHAAVYPWMECGVQATHLTDKVWAGGPSCSMVWELVTRSVFQSSQNLLGRGPADVCFHKSWKGRGCAPGLRTTAGGL